MKVKMIMPFNYNQGLVINKGEELLMRSLPVGFLKFEYQCIDGPHSGVKIPYERFIEISEERTYTEAEYNALKLSLDMANDGIKRLEEMVDIKDVALQNALSAIPAPTKKVPLPREVADAIEYCERVGRIERVDILPLLNVIGNLVRDYSPPVIKYLQVIKEYATSPADNRLKLMKALVDGYTVEVPAETPKDKAIQYLIKKNLVARGHSEHDVVAALMNILGVDEAKSR